MRNPRIQIAPRLMLAGLALLTSFLLSAPAAFASEACPNEAVRTASRVNPTTGKPYSQGLPECRAYEMVSPLEKQQHDALPMGAVYAMHTSVSPDGSAIQWTSQGAYAGAENYQVHGNEPTNPYVAHRTASGWVTRSGYPPSSLIEGPFPAFASSGVYSPDLASEAVCGTVAFTGPLEGPTIRCALREPGGSWASTPEYTDLTGQHLQNLFTEGASRTGEDVVFYSQAGVAFLSSDTSSTENPCLGGPHCGGIYEVAGVGTSQPELRLVNVDNNGSMIGPEEASGLGALGESRSVEEEKAYQAVSANGSTIFFTATPNASNGFGSSVNVKTVFARIDGTSTVDISNPSPSECTRCTQEAEEGKPESSEAKPATYQGASADGSKVFFTTTQQLVNGDTDSSPDLYEYDFNNPPGHRIVQVSAGGLGDVSPGAGAEVGGVASISEDGSHVYFMAMGVLTTLPNGLGQTASQGSHNLYAYDTNTGETKFIATLLGSDKQLWGEQELISGSTSVADVQQAQTTPDGRYLVFDSFAKLITAGPEADTSGAQQVYRYDFQTGQLIRVSIGHEGFANNGNTPGVGAVIGAADVHGEGASPTANDGSRSISENGGIIAFVTTEQLQSTDVAGGSNSSCVHSPTAAGGAGCEVYAWHECTAGPCATGAQGEVSMISDGQDPAGMLFTGMSATGSDIFFQTRTQLVGQDTDTLGDIYDARIGGGFPAPSPEPSCSGEACQGSAPSAPAFGASGTSSLTAGGNATPGSTAFPPPEEPKAKPLTRAQKLAKALKQCKKDKAKAKRGKCEKEAKKKYGPVKKKARKK
jgi:hypothetical protein